MKLTTLFSTMLVTASLIGCSSGTVGSYDKTDKGYETNINYNSTVLATRVKVSDIKTRRVDDLMQVSVDLHNHWDFTLDFQYKFKFFDKDGFEVGADTRPWSPIVLTGNETASVQAVAPNPSAQTFKIYVQD